jgi:translation initiation factor IF-1
MGWYTAVKPFARKLGDAVIRQKRGDRVFIELREEAESLLRDKAVVRGKQKLPKLADEVRQPDQDAEYKATVSALAKETGLTYAACHAKVKQYTHPNQKTGEAMPLEEAIMRLRGSLHLLDDAGKIELLALDKGIAGNEANDCISLVMERDGCSLDEAIVKIRSGQTEAEEQVENEIVDANESGNEGTGDEQGLTEGIRVMADYKGEIRYGTVVKVCGNDEVRVKLDGDEAEYRRLSREDLDVVTEEEGK